MAESDTPNGRHPVHCPDNLWAFLRALICCASAVSLALASKAQGTYALLAIVSVAVPHAALTIARLVEKVKK